MTRKHTPIQTSSFKGWKLIPQPQPAWTAIIGLYAVIFLLLAVGLGPLVILIYPLGSLAVGIFLYRRYPILYVGFTWWTWFLVGLIRRIIDYRCGYVTPWPTYLTPLLVTAVSGITLLRYLPKTYKRDGLPFAICFVCVLYGFFVGLIRQQPITNYEGEIILFLRWSTPIFFGFHLFTNWRLYPQYRQNIQRVFLWGVLIMGCYGIIQFLVAPEWDRFFLFNYRDARGGTTWMGSPEPLGIRVWSTMNDTFSFAFNLMPGLILLSISKSRWRFPAGVVGYLAFLLSRSRTGWYSWLITMVVYIFSVKGRNQIRSLTIIVAIVAVVVPLITIEPFSDILLSRLETFSNIGNDASYIGRIEQYQQSLDYAFSQFLGYGLIDVGRTPDGIFSTNDNGFLVILVSFGWLAGIPYIGAVIMLFSRLFLNSANYLDLFAIVARSVALGSLMRMFTSNITSGDFALPIWGFLGLAMAAHNYYLHQSLLEKKTARISN